jgi:hypothetical protein
MLITECGILLDEGNQHLYRLADELVFCARALLSAQQLIADG